MARIGSGSGEGSKIPPSQDVPVGAARPSEPATTKGMAPGGAAPADHVAEGQTHGAKSERRPAVTPRAPDQEKVAHHAKTGASLCHVEPGQFSLGIQTRDANFQSLVGVAYKGEVEWGKVGGEFKATLASVGSGDFGAHVVDAQVDALAFEAKTIVTARPDNVEFTIKTTADLVSAGVSFGNRSPERHGDAVLRLGANVGVGGEWSSYLKDQDNDGYPELGIVVSGELAIGATIGIEVETPVVLTDIINAGKMIGAEVFDRLFAPSAGK